MDGVGGVEHGSKDGSKEFSGHFRFVVFPRVFGGSFLDISRFFSERSGLAVLDIKYRDSRFSSSFRWLALRA